MSVEITAVAAADLDAAVQWLAERSLAAAERLHAEVLARIAALDGPALGSHDGRMKPIER
jgi:plasmid stabilization system protein ParE